jgi:beta-hydroxyacyl-ACP dehydratase FabZ
MGERTMDVNEIMEHLPHRFPMLLVDRILDYEPGKNCVGIKNVTINDAFFQGHYPGFPIMPGVLIVEAMAQAGAVILLTDPKYMGMIPVIGAIDDVRFKRQVVPGDQLRSEVELLWIRGTIGRMKCVAKVEDTVCASMEMTFKLIEREQ